MQSSTFPSSPTFLRSSRSSPSFLAAFQAAVGSVARQRFRTRNLDTETRALAAGEEVATSPRGSSAGASSARVSSPGMTSPSVTAAHLASPRATHPHVASRRDLARQLRRAFDFVRGAELAAFRAAAGEVIRGAGRGARMVMRALRTVRAPFAATFAASSSRHRALLRDLHACGHVHVFRRPSLLRIWEPLREQPSAHAEFSG